MRDLNDPSPTNQAAFEAMVRRYLMKVTARYMPVAAIALAVALILVFYPTKQSNSGLSTASGAYGAGAGASGANASGGSQLPTGAPQSGGGAASPGVGPVGAGAGASAAGGAVGVGASTAAGGAGSAPAGVPGPSTPSGVTPPSSVGVAKTGVKCGPGVRQFTWSAYAPPCVAAWHGNNGGATGQGVTANTITLTYRLANSAQQTAIDSLAGAANINQDAFVADLQSYINFFNTQYELYGRHVVLKTYQGQGDYIEEDQGQGLGATQADAQNVQQMGAFGDVTFSLEASEPYEEDLAAEHVIGFSGVGMSEQWFLQHAPYEYSVQSASGTNAITATAAVVCQRMVGMPAIYAGNPVYQKTSRKFGIIFPQTPVYTAEVQELQQLLQQGCGVKAQSYGYSINVAEYEQEAASIMAQLAASNVTTVLCACDPIADIFLSNSADGQQYFPEWVASYFGDPVARNYDQKEWAHVITGGFQWPAYQTVEPYRTFELAYPGKQPAETPPTSPRYYYDPYYTLLQVFGALQAAGPDLTAATFERGMFSLPSSNPGDFIGGVWKFGQGVFDPISSYTFAWWNPNAISAFDGTKGAYQWCNGGQSYSIFDPKALGGPREQLHCFGQ